MGEGATNVFFDFHFTSHLEERVCLRATALTKIPLCLHTTANPIGYKGHLFIVSSSSCLTCALLVCFSIFKLRSEDENDELNHIGVHVLMYYIICSLGSVRRRENGPSPVFCSVYQNVTPFHC